MAILKRRKSSKPPGRRWLKRKDYIFFYFFGFLVVASILASHLPQSSRSSISSQAPIFASSPASSSSTGSSSGSASQGGYGNLTSSQSTNPNQVPASNANGTAGQTTPAQPQQPGSSKDIGDDWLVGNNGLLAWTDPNLTYTNPKVGTAWSGMLAIADLFLVLFIMINGIRIALGGAGFRYADALEALPRIVLAFAAAHLSWYFIASLIGINNGLCTAVVTIARQNNLVYTGGLTIKDIFTQGFTVLMEVIAWIVANAIPVIGQAIQVVDIGAIVTSSIQILLDLTLLTLYAFLLVQLIIRLAMINLLYILAPLGFASWSLPQGAGQQLTRIWLNATFAAVMVQFLQLCAYTFGLLLFNPISGLTNMAVGALGFNVIDLGVLFKLPIVWFTLRIPGLVQNIATNMMGEGSRNLSAMLSQALGAAQSALSTIVIAGFR